MSFRLKTIVGVALIEACLLIVLVLSGISYLTESSEDELALRARVTAESLANVTRDAVLASDLARLGSVVRQTLESPDLVYVRIRDTDRVLAEAGDASILSRPFVADASFDDAVDGVFDVAVDITEAGFDLGRIELGLSIDRASALIGDAGRHLTSIALAEMLLVGLFSYMLGAYLTRGLDNLAWAAREISEGSLEARVVVSGDDELAATGKAFNEMSRRVAESQRAMQRSVEESQALAHRLADREKRLSTILEAAVDGFITIDEHGVIEELNNAAARLFGYRREALVGQNVSCLMPERDGLRHDGYIRRYLDTGHAGVIGRGRRVEGLRKNGETFPMDLAVSEMVIDGQHRFVGLVRDVSEQLRAESEVRKSEAMRAAIVEANLDGLITVDADDRIVEFSRISEEMFGHRRADVIGQPMATLIIPPEMQEMHRAGMRRYFATGEGPVLGNRIEVEAMHADGSRIPVELTVQPIVVNDETYFTAMVRDISSRKAEERILMEAKQAAEVASEAKSRFLAHMSHEIRSPLNAVLGSLTLLQEADLDDAQRLYARTAESSGKILLSLINDILDFSKIEAGHLELAEESYDLRALVTEAVDLVTFRARDKGLQLAAVVDRDVPQTVMGDVARLRQVLGNLLDNAVKFTDRGAVVLGLAQRRAADGEQRLVFCVEDSGIGIADEQLPGLFDEFRQVDNSSTTRFGGSGLGLSISEALVDLMGGKIEVESEAGQGSRFCVDIPLVISGDTQSGDSPVRLDRSSGVAVGFHPLIAEILHRILGNRGWRLDIAATVDDAMAAAGPDTGFMLVSAEMAQEDLDRLARIPLEGAASRRVLVSARDTEESRRLVIEHDFEQSLSMPINEAKLIEVLGEEQSAMPRKPVEQVSPGDGSYTACRLLLAEDSIANQVVARAMLEGAGFQVDVAGNGEEAIQLFRDTAYDAILMDIRMPGVDGLAATAGIRAMPEGSEIPIIAMTANAMREDVDRCREAGMDAFVPKPIDKAVLLQTLARHLPCARPVAEVPQPRPDQGSRIPLLDPQVISQLEADVTPAAMPAMLQMFVKESVERADRVKRAVQSGEDGVLEDEAHTLKSCAGTFGARRLQALARDVESACREERHEEAVALARTIDDVLAETLNEYRQEFADLMDSED